jgi:hypothetical protein
MAKLHYSEKISSRRRDSQSRMDLCYPGYNIRCSNNLGDQANRRCSPPHNLFDVMQLDTADSNKR